MIFDDHLFHFITGRINISKLGRVKEKEKGSKKGRRKRKI